MPYRKRIFSETKQPSDFRHEKSDGCFSLEWLCDTPHAYLFLIRDNNPKSHPIAESGLLCFVMSVRYRLIRGTTKAEPLPFLVLNVTGDGSDPCNPGFRVMHRHEERNWDFRFSYLLIKYCFSLPAYSRSTADRFSE